MKEGLEKYQKQHDENYHAAVIDTIHDNTVILIEEDLMPLFKKPPLDSMDILKMKILGNAKDTGVILSLETLEKMIEDYRNEMLPQMQKIGDFREQQITDIINHAVSLEKAQKETTLLSSFSSIKEQSTKNFKPFFDEYMREHLIPGLSQLLDENKNGNVSANDLFLSNTSEYLTQRYPEFILDCIEDKICLKNNILVNRLKEHRERYEFTKEHSRLLEYQGKDLKSNR